MVDKKKKDKSLASKNDANQRMNDANSELEKLEAELKARANDASDKADSKKEPSTQKPSAAPSSQPSASTATYSSKDKPSAKPENKSKPEPSASFSSSSQRSQSASSHSQQNNKKSGGISILGLFGFLFGLIALAGVAYLYWLQQQTALSHQQQLEQNQVIAQQSLVETRRTVEKVQNNLTALESNQQNNNEFVQDTQRQLTSLTARIKELGQVQPNTWLAAESLYLVNLAERRLLIEQDINTAIQLLVDANIRLDAMNDPSVFYLRQAISEDLALLAAIPKPDTDSVYLALSGVIRQLETLPLAHIYVPDPAELPTKPEISDDVNDWQANLLASVKRFMGNFISVTRRESAVEPELPPKQRWFVRANIRQQLLIAQQSVLEGNVAIYQDALTNVERWLKQYFDLTQPSVVASINTIIELNKKNVAQVLPANLSSQALLNKHVVGLMQLQQQQLQEQLRTPSPSETDLNDSEQSEDRPKTVDDGGTESTETNQPQENSTEQTSVETEVNNG